MSDEGTRQDLERRIALVVAGHVPGLTTGIYRDVAKGIRAILDISPEELDGDPNVYRWVSAWHRKTPVATAGTNP